MNITQVRRFALSLPDVTEEPHHQYSSFRVAGKIFVTVPPENTHLHLFVPEELREQALATWPAVAEKLLWGGKVVGLRVMLNKADAALVKAWIREAWQHKASPKKRPSKPGEDEKSTALPDPETANPAAADSTKTASPKSP